MIVNHYYFRWKTRFPSMKRIIHRIDSAGGQIRTQDCEILLQGNGPWNPAPGIQILHTPG